VSSVEPRDLLIGHAVLGLEVIELRAPDRDDVGVDDDPFAREHTLLVDGPR